MVNANIAVLMEKRSKLMVDAAALLQAAEVTAEGRASAHKMLADVEQIEQDIEALNRTAAFDAKMSSFDRSPRPVPGADKTGSVEERKAQLNQAFRTFARHGYSALSTEQRALLTTSDVTGGALIPQEFDGVLREAKLFYGGIANKVAQKVTNANGAPIKISLANDTVNGMVLLATEGTSAPSETDPTFVSKLLGVDTVSAGLVKVSFQELDDAAFDLDSFIRGAFGKRYGRGLEHFVTLGKDTAGTALPNQTSGGLLGVAQAVNAAGNLAAGIGWADIVALYGAVDPAYLGPNTGWSFNAATRTALLQMKDGFGRPFWVPDPTAATPFDKLLGYDVVLNQAMPNMGVANAMPIIFGDLQESYMLRTDGAPSILRLNERFADTLEVGFYLYTRVGGTSLDAGTHPLQGLKLQAA